MSLVFATATGWQLAEVERLIRAAFTPYVRALGREIPADAYGWFGDAIGQGDIYVALDGAEVVGAMATRWHGDDLELALIGVSPARQKSGVASRMLAEIEPVARARGARTLSLMTAEMMQDRVRLYGRHGFHVVRRGPPEHGKDAHVRVYMEKALHDP